MNPRRDEPGRHKPASGVHIDLGQPTIVFVTVDAEHRAAWIAQPNVHQLLLEVWREAQAWLVDWDTRLRRSESYAEKWGYIRENPMRKGLVTKPEDWPYQGMMNILRW